MKFKYIDKTDTFYLMLSNSKSVESEEIAENIIVDYDEHGKLIGLEILSAKSTIDFTTLQIDALPFTHLSIANSKVVA